MYIKQNWDFLWIIDFTDSKDSGEYTCRAWNKYGEDTISCQLQCEGKSGVQRQSLHPDALVKIKNIELTGTRWPMLLLP